MRAMLVENKKYTLDEIWDAIITYSTDEEKPEEQENYSIRQILADIYACKVTDCNGNMPVDMEDLYLSIKRIFKAGDGKEFSEEYIRSCAEHKIREGETRRKSASSTKEKFF